MLTAQALVKVLKEHPDRAVQIETEQLSGINVDDVAYDANRRTESVDTVIETDSNGLALYARWIVFKPEEA